MKMYQRKTSTYRQDSNDLTPILNVIGSSDSMILGLLVQSTEL